MFPCVQDYQKILPKRERQKMWLLSIITVRKFLHYYGSMVMVGSLSPLIVVLANGTRIMLIFRFVNQYYCETSPLILP